MRLWCECVCVRVRAWARGTASASGEGEAVRACVRVHGRGCVPAVCRRLSACASASASASSLQVIDASHNGLGGTIPDSYGRLPLTHLDLSFNDLVGSLPASLDCLTQLR